MGTPVVISDPSLGHALLAQALHAPEHERLVGDVGFLDIAVGPQFPVVAALELAVLPGVDETCPESVIRHGQVLVEAKLGEALARGGVFDDLDHEPARGAFRQTGERCLGGEGLPREGQKRGG